MNDQLETAATPETPATQAPEASGDTETPATAPAPVTLQDPPEPGQTLFSKISRAIDRAISDMPGRTGWEIQTYMLLDSVGGYRLIASKEGLATLRNLQGQYDAIIKFINSHTPQASFKAYTESQRALAAAIHAGTVHEMEGQSREDFDRNYAHQMEAAKGDLRRIYKESLPICFVTCERFVVLATKRVDDMERAERERHDYFGVPYAGPSNLILQFRKAITTAQTRTVESHYGNYSPRQMCPYLPF